MPLLLPPSIYYRNLIKIMCTLQGYQCPPYSRFLVPAGDLKRPEPPQSDSHLQLSKARKPRCLLVPPLPTPLPPDPEYGYGRNFRMDRDREVFFTVHLPISGRGRAISTLSQNATALARAAKAKAVNKSASATRSLTRASSKLYSSRILEWSLACWPST
jgi:hypothetical protein